MTIVQEDKGSGRLHIVIPKSVAKLKGWKKGTELEFMDQMGFVCLMEKK